MSVREYIGARYVPVFADPVNWDATQTYEPLTVVLYQGNSYTSKQAVPANIDIANTTYWAQTGNYNAQIEQYKQEVQTFDGRITDNADAISDEITARQEAVQAEATARQNADTALGNRIITLEKTKYMLIIGDSYSNYASGNYTEYWWEIVARHIGRTPLNYSVGGSGFALDNSFMNQAVSASSNAHANDIDTIYVFGGLNDFSRNVSGSDFSSACASLFAYLKTTFSGAKIIVGGVQSAQNQNKYSDTSTVFEYNRLGYLTSLLSTECCKKEIPMIDFSKFGPFISNYYVAANNVHPTQQGQTAIATKFLGGSVWVSNSSVTDRPQLWINNSYYSTAKAPRVVNLGNNMCGLSFEFADFPANDLTNNATLHMRGLPATNGYPTVIELNRGRAVGGYVNAYDELVGGVQFGTHIIIPRVRILGSDTSTSIHLAFEYCITI